MTVSFTELTGPIGGRRTTSPVVAEKMWPFGYEIKGHDMTALTHTNTYLVSKDRGATWAKAGAEAFGGPMKFFTGGAELYLSDRTYVRGVWGQFLPYNPRVPKTGYIQRSRDLQIWTDPESVLDPAEYSVFPSRLRSLRDGRVLFLGGCVRAPANSKTMTEYTKAMKPVMQVSNDGGRTWSAPIDVLPPAHGEGWTEEWDAAELANGNLLCVFRRRSPSGYGGEAGQTSWQCVLQKVGETWVPQALEICDWPVTGHPELLATNGGGVLYIAHSGIELTTDGGQTWEDLKIATGCNPRSLQAADGTIFVFSHAGGDDAYGSFDQSILMDSFRLK